MITLTSAALITLAVFVAVLMFVLWLTNWIGLPGNWFMLLAGLLYWILLWNQEQTTVSITWVTILALAVLATIGELLEFVASSAATSGAGGSRRSVALALVGSMAGGVIGLFVALPIPLIGPLVGALVFGGAGAFAGAVLGEKWAGQDTEKSIEVGKAAFVGRMLGTFTKAAVGLLMVLWFVGSLVL